MSTRSLILREAVALLAESSSGDISTRAVCEAAGVAQPALYRIFGDKDGLLAAVADSVWGEYLEMKRSAEPSADPLVDLRNGWDRHLAFALAQPHAYRLVFASGLSTRPAAMGEAMGLLEGILQRLAAAGRLSMPPAEAARLVMAANSGLALGMILRPELYPPEAPIEPAREAVIRAIVLDDPAGADDPAVPAAVTLEASLQRAHGFTGAERALLSEWLGRFRRSAIEPPAETDSTPQEGSTP